MKNKLIILSASLLIVIFGFLMTRSVNRDGNSRKLSETSITQEQPSEKSVTVAIDYGNGESIKENYPYSEDETAFSVLEKITLENNIPLETEEYDFGVFVKSIDGLESGSEMSWIYFVNGESGQVAADTYQLNPEDIVYWSYVEPAE